MYYVYLILSTKIKELYIGYTNNLENRLDKHNTGKNKSTKNKGRWILTYAEMYKGKQDALTREKRLKYYRQALNELKKRTKRSLALANLVRG